MDGLIIIIINSQVGLLLICRPILFSSPPWSSSCQQVLVRRDGFGRRSNNLISVKTTLLLEVLMAPLGILSFMCLPC